MVAKFETALKLRDAGFPQPEFADGQRWYLKNNPKNIISIIENNEGHENEMVPSRIFGCDRWANYYSKSALSNPNSTMPLVFAPTVQDILEQMPSFKLTFNWSDGLWDCRRFGHWDCQEHESAVEACAAAWFDQKENGII